MPVTTTDVNPSRPRDLLPSERSQDLSTVLKGRAVAWRNAADTADTAAARHVEAAREVERISDVPGHADEHYAHAERLQNEADRHRERAKAADDGVLLHSPHEDFSMRHPALTGRAAMEGRMTMDNHGDPNADE
ncbi:MAG: hypothetical protein ACYC61_14145 [Isosphaeraceae bacterium]